MAGTSRSLLCQSFGHHGYISRDQPYAEEARQGKLWDNLSDTNWKFPMHTDFEKDVTKPVIQVLGHTVPCWDTARCSRIMMQLEDGIRIFP